MVTIAAGQTRVTEGTAVEFTLTARPDPAAPLTVLTVNVSWSDSGDRLKDPPPGTVTIPTNGSATLSLETEDDMTVEPESVVTATIDSGTGYTLGTPASAEVTVRDAPTGSAPVVTIAAGQTRVTEGTAVEFTLTARPDPAAPLTVNVIWSDLGDRLRDSPPVTVTIPPTGSFTLSLETEDDMTVDLDSVVTATIDSGTGYTPGTPRSATVTVEDAPTGPTVSVAGLGPGPGKRSAMLEITLEIDPTVNAIINGKVTVVDSAYGGCIQQSISCSYPTQRAQLSAIASGPIQDYAGSIFQVIVNP